MATTLVALEEYLNTSYPDGDREYVDGRIVERHVGEISHGDVQTAIAVYLRTHYRGLLWAATAVRTQVRPTRFRVPDVVAVLGSKPDGQVITRPPFIVVEIISPDDRVDELQEKIDDYLEFGVPHVWVINPRNRRTFVYTADAVHEVKTGVLLTADPVIEMPLAEIFG